VAKVGPAAALALALALAVAATPAAAAAQSRCEALKEEHGRLVAAGVPRLMANGPEWARTNLSAADLGLIKLYIEVDEELTFRCTRPKPVNTRIEQAETEAAPKDVIEDQDGRSALPTGPDGGATPAAATVKPAPERKAPSSRPPAGQPAAVRPKAAAPAAAPAPEGGQQKEAAKPKPKPKPKANDAYVPPPPGTQPAGGLADQARRLDGQPKAQ
jgi:hypothetical protein